MKSTFSPASFALAAALGLGGSALAQDASLTVLHGVPGLPAPVDVFADGAPLFSFCYEEQRGPLALPPGTYAVEVRLEGQTVLSDSFTLSAGDDATVIANLDAGGSPVLSAFVNDRSPLALPSARVAVRHAAQAPAVDVVVSQGGAPVLTIPGVVNGQEASVDVPPGTYEVELFVAGTTTSAFGPVPLVLEDGFRYGVHAVGVALEPSFALLVQRDALAARVRSMEGLQFANFDPELYLDGVLVADYDQLVEGPVAVQPGTYSAEVRIFGGTTTLLTRSVTLAAGDDRTLQPHLGLLDLFRFADLGNDVSALDLVSNARVTVRHLALAPAVDVIVTKGGSPVATIAGLVNGDEAVAELPAGDYEVAIAAAGTTSPLFGPVALTFAARTNTVAQALGDLSSTFTVGVDVIDLSGVAAPAELYSRRFGTSCGPTVRASANCLFFGEEFEVVVENAWPDSGTLVVWGPSSASVAGLPLPLDATPFGAPGCSLYADPRFLQVLPTDGAGRAVTRVRVPASLAPVFPGITFQAIAPSNNPAHLATSGGLELTRD